MSDLDQDQRALDVPLPDAPGDPATGPRARVRAVGRDRPHLRRGRRRAVLLRLSDAEYRETAVAALESGLTPTGYAAEATLAAARGVAAPSREPLRVVLAELIAARLQLARVTRVHDRDEAQADHLGPGDVRLQAAVRAVAAVDQAAAAVARALP